MSRRLLRVRVIFDLLRATLDLFQVDGLIVRRGDVRLAVIIEIFSVVSRTAVIVKSHVQGHLHRVVLNIGSIAVYVVFRTRKRGTLNILLPVRRLRASPLR